MEFTYPDPNNPEEVVGRSEVERRREYIEQLEEMLHGGEHHPLTQMVKQCLQNAPSRRPTTEQLVSELQRVRADVEGAYGEFAKLDAVRQVVIMKTLRRREAEVREKTDELTAKDEEIQLLQVRKRFKQHVCVNKEISLQYLLCHSQARTKFLKCEDSSS